MKKITMTAPDDWHCHLRDEKYLSRTVPDIAARFRRALVMPNLKPPVTTVIQAIQYAERIRQHIPQGSSFHPLITLYLTEDTQAKLIHEAKDTGFIIACKLYPAGATTHSAAGVKDLQKINTVLEAMQEKDMVLCIHGESIEPEVDVFDREQRFIEKYLAPLIKRFPNLRIVLEHVSTKTAVDFVTEAPSTLAATITVHHLLLNRNDLLVGGLHPHYYCLPVLKRNTDQEALLKAAMSGNPKFFLGTDSAPHSVHNKEACLCAAGIYTAYSAIELYAEVFDHHHQLDRLEGFASLFGAQFYKLPVNEDKITLTQEAWQVPATLAFGDEQVVPFRAGEEIRWKLGD
jgi:dihydroorotase